MSTAATKAPTTETTPSGGRQDGPMSAAERKAFAQAWLDQGNNPVGLLRHAYPATYGRAVACGMTPDEVRSACHYGVMRAVRLFDPARGWKFNTYVVQHLRAAVQDTLRRNGRHTHRPDGKFIGSGDARFSDGGETVFDTLPAPAPEDAGAVVELVAMVRHHIHERVTSERDRHVLELRWGLDGNDARTLSEVSQVFGVSRERVRQIEERAFSRLRPVLASVWDGNG